MSKVDSQLLSDSIDKILAFSKGEEVDGEAGKKRNFLETIELQVILYLYSSEAPTLRNARCPVICPLLL